MALFDGSGSFGLGLGGFDISDFTGLTGNGGLGSMNFDGLNSVQPINTVSNTINNPTSSLGLDSGTIDPTTGLAKLNSSNPFDNLPGTNTTNTDTVGQTDSNNLFGEKSGLGGKNFMDIAKLAYGIYSDQDNRSARNHQMNENTRVRNNALARSRKIGKQLRTGEVDEGNAQKDYKYY